MSWTIRFIRSLLNEFVFWLIARQCILRLKRPSFVSESFLFLHWRQSRVSIRKTPNYTSIQHGRQMRTHRWELSEQFTIFQATKGESSLQTRCLYPRNGRLDTKWRSSQTKSNKDNSRTALNGTFVTKHKILGTLVYSPFTLFLSKSVFCQDMVVSLCFIFCWMLHVYESNVSVAVFETRWPPKHYLRSTDNRTVWTWIFEGAWSKAEGNISYNYRFHISERFKS